MPAPFTDAEIAAFGRVFTSIPGHGPQQHTRFHAAAFPPDSSTAEASAVPAMVNLNFLSAAPEADRVAVCHAIARDWSAARSLAVMASSMAAGRAEHAAAN